MFSDAEIKKLTVGQVNLLIQRYNEPEYKAEIDRAIRKEHKKA